MEQKLNKFLKFTAIRAENSVIPGNSHGNFWMVDSPEFPNGNSRWPRLNYEI